MKLNEDCIRDTLSILVNELIFIIDKKYNKVEFGKLTFFDIKNEFNQYTNEDICQSLYILAQNNYMRGKHLLDMNGQLLSTIYVNEVTYLGYQFYESIQPEPIWQKTKTILKQVGVHSLNFIESVAHDVAAECAKQIIPIIVSNQE